VDGPHLSVIALNVQYYSHGLENVVRTLNELDADVYLLSENVLDAAGAERARRLFAPRDFRMGRPGETAIASRYPVLSFKEVDFPSTQPSLSGPNWLGNGAASREHRSFSHAVLDVKGTRVNVVSLRLIAGRAPESNLLAQLEWGAYLIRTQAEELATFERYVAQQQGPLIFGGDMNAPPSATIVKALREHFTDAYLAQHFFGATTFRVRPVSYLRLDYLFSSRNVQPLSSRRVDVEVSDHYPVFAEFALPRGT
jgi:endonuclease/exonuclease/phosphatase (EEP) superfamily protein YafD